MVIDNLKNSNTYEHIHPLFKRAFEYLSATDFQNVPTGKVELDGEKLFAIISDSELKNRVSAKLEIHNRYIDIQMPVSRSETFGWMHRGNLLVEEDVYNEEKDIQFFFDKTDTFLTISPNNFLIFFPEDAHAPCIGEGTIRKVVVKIMI